MDIGRHIAGAQMPPGSLRRVVVDRAPGVAPRAAQLDSTFMIHPDVPFSSNTTGKMGLGIRCST